MRFRALSNSITSTMNLSLQKAMGLPRLTLLRKNPSDASLFMVLDAKWANWAACSRERSGGNRASFLNAASTSSRDRGLRPGNRLSPCGCPSWTLCCGFMFLSSTVILVQPGRHPEHRAPQNPIDADTTIFLVLRTTAHRLACFCRFLFSRFILLRPSERLQRLR